MYHLYGSHIGNLAIRKQYGDWPDQETITIIAGNNGNTWKTVALEVASNNRPFRLSFNATRGAGFRGDIGLDDVFYRTGRCNKGV